MRHAMLVTIAAVKGSRTTTATPGATVRGPKENVTMGRLAPHGGCRRGDPAEDPAGTGFEWYKNVTIPADEPPPPGTPIRLPDWGPRPPPPTEEELELEREMESLANHGRPDLTDPAAPRLFCRP